MGPNAYLQLPLQQHACFLRPLRDARLQSRKLRHLRRQHNVTFKTAQGHLKLTCTALTMVPLLQDHSLRSFPHRTHMRMHSLGCDNSILTNSAA